MEEELVLVEHDGPVSVLTINRPSKLNALNISVLASLFRQVRKLSEREELRCLIVRGAGDRAFVAGADIAAMKDMGEAEALAFSQKGHEAFSALEKLKVPVIAAVHGFALGGGCELALACDFIHASEKARFGQPEVKLGVIPGFGGTQRLVRRVGIARAREIVFSGAILKPDEALSIGIVNKVHPVDGLMPAVMDLAMKISTMGPIALAEAKKVMASGADVPLHEANRLESRAFARCFDSRDQKEGMQAFLEGRDAEFKGR